MNTVKQILGRAKFKETIPTLSSELLFSTDYNVSSVLGLITNAVVQQTKLKGDNMVLETEEMENLQSENPASDK